MVSKWHPVYLEPLLHAGPSGAVSRAATRPGPHSWYMQSPYLNPSRDVLALAKASWRRCPFWGVDVGRFCESGRLWVGRRSRESPGGSLGQVEYGAGPVPTSPGCSGSSVSCSASFPDTKQE